jgi:hypothetical protein
MRLKLADTMGIIVDVQDRLFPHIHDREPLAAALERLVRGLAVLEVPLLWGEQYPKGLGATIEPLRTLLAGRPRFEKLSFSCCAEPAFFDEIRRTGRRAVILAGLETHDCVLQTCLDLLEAGFSVAVVEDAVGSRKPDDRRVALERMRQEGARLTTVESLLFELIRRAGSEAFRQISRLIK